MFSEACGTDPSDAAFCPVTAPGRTWRPNSREAIGNDKTFRLQTDNARPINAGRSASESGKRVLQQKSGKKPEALSRHNDRNIRKSAQRFFPNRNESTVKSSPASLSPRKRRVTERTPSTGRTGTVSVTLRDAPSAAGTSTVPTGALHKLSVSTSIRPPACGVTVTLNVSAPSPKSRYLNVA